MLTLNEFQALSRDAAEGDLDAMYQLARAFIFGDIYGEPDIENGVRLLENAANRGHAGALHLAGELHEKTKKYKKALECFTKASNLGHKPSWSKMYYYYITGKGTKKDPNLALYWARKAFKAGDKAIASYTIAGILESKGKGKKAQKYYKISYKNGNESAKEKLIKQTK